MKRIHLNWSGYRNWHAARAKLGFLKTTLYGNFADVKADSKEVKAELEARGFKVNQEWPGKYEDVRFVLYGVNE